MSELERQESETQLEPLEREWRSGKSNNVHVFEDFHTEISKPFFSGFVASLVSNTFDANILWYVAQSLLQLSSESEY